MGTEREQTHRLTASLRCRILMSFKTVGALMLYSFKLLCKPVDMTGFSCSAVFSEDLTS
jgi:hypothetical protein